MGSDERRKSYCSCPQMEHSGECAGFTEGVVRYRIAIRRAALAEGIDLSAAPGRKG
jgi:hypothetical protein